MRNGSMEGKTILNNLLIRKELKRRGKALEK